VAAQVIAESRCPGPGSVGRRAHRPSSLGQTLETVDELAQARSGNGLGLGAVIHAHSVTVRCPGRVAATALAVTVLLQTSAVGSRPSSDVADMDVRPELAVERLIP
jgi:hypothetical protein